MESRETFPDPLVLALVAALVLAVSYKVTRDVFAVIDHDECVVELYKEDLYCSEEVMKKVDACMSLVGGGVGEKLCDDLGVRLSLRCDGIFADGIEMCE